MQEASVLPSSQAPCSSAPLDVPTEEFALPTPDLSTSIVAALDLTQRLGGLTGSEHLSVRSKRNSLILLRKPALSSTAPRVPSTLRIVVDGGAALCAEGYVGGDSDDDTIDNITATANSSAVAITAADKSTAPTMPLALQMPSPIPRRESHGPALASLVGKPVDRSKCLPYPHTMDCYTPKPRPHSLSTISSYSVGQVIASPSLILQGNRDISRGTAQINLSRHQHQRKRSEIQSCCTSTPTRLSRRSVLSMPEPTRDRKSSSGSGGGGGSSTVATSTINRLRAYWRQPMKAKPAPGTNLLVKEPNLLKRPLSVMEMAFAAETAAEMELAEASTSLLTIRALATKSAATNT
ncbi:hypothetical protein GGI20_000691 [Coemansia sp. BCRC 34301]|nr:hypothetical protein GGI20_000691 [Coemansia sp. BCRC 34301]